MHEFIGKMHWKFLIILIENIEKTQKPQRKHKHNPKVNGLIYNFNGLSDLCFKPFTLIVLNSILHSVSIRLILPK